MHCQCCHHRHQCRHHHHHHHHQQQHYRYQFPHNVKNRPQSIQVEERYQPMDRGKEREKEKMEGR